MAASRPLVAFRSGHFLPIIALAVDSALAIFPFVSTASHGLPSPWVFAMHAARRFASRLTSLRAARLAADRQETVGVSAPAKRAPCGPPKVRAAIAATSPMHASCTRAVTVAGVAAAP